MSFSEMLSAPISNSAAIEKKNSESQNLIRSCDSLSTDFLRAAKTGNFNAVLSLLRGGVDINFSINGLNAVHLASKEGHHQIVRELLKRGAGVDATTKKKNTALHIASLAGQIEVVKVLLEFGADVNSQSVNGFTPLYMAAQENHVDVVQLLLANKANQNLSTEDGFTPLAVALQQGHKKVVEILLENDCKGKVRLPALHIAAKKNDTSSANLLLQYNVEPELNTRERLVNCVSKNGFTPLHIAAHYGNLEIAELLISKGADVSFPAKHNITPLHVAAKWGKDKVVRLLLQNNAQIDAKTQDGLTPLHCAARCGHEQVVDTLLEKGAPITAKTKNGLTALHMTAQGDHVDAAKVLLSYKSSIIDDVTCDYLTPLHIAAHCGHLNIARLLIDRKADIRAKALNGFTPLHIACKKNHANIVLLLLKCGANVDVTTESGLTPLHVAAFIGALSILSLLIENGANQECATIRGETAIHIAARSNQIDSLKCLIQNGSNVNAMSLDNQTALHIATYLGNNECVLFLLRNGADVEAITKDGYTSIHIAAKEGHCDVAISLIENGASLVAMTKKGFTPLHVACKHGNIKVASILLQKGAVPDIRGRNGLTPLHVATHYNHPSIVLILLRSGCSPHDAAMNGYTPLHIAAKKNHMEVVTMLLEYNVHVDARSNGGFVPLHLACQEGYIDIVSVLIFHHADVNARSKNLLTPLHLCAQEDRVACAQLLIKHGAFIDPQTEGGYTPLHVASHFGHVNMVKFLLQIEANLHAETKHGYTPLHCAAQQGHLAIVRLLLEHGASPNKVNRNGQTPFIIAQKLGNISIIEELKSVTEVIVYNKVEITTEDRYKIQMPERLHEEQPLSDSDDDSGGDMLADQSIAHMQYLHDENFSHDHEEPGGLEHTPKMEKRASHAVNLATSSPVEDEVPSHFHSSSSSFMNNDLPAHIRLRGFLVSFIVNAKGAVMRGCRHSGVKVIIPPSRASCPTRITCRFVTSSKSPIEPPLNDGDTLASRVLEIRPAGYQFLGPIIIELPHFASLKDGQREVVVYRSDNGEKWTEHSPKATDQLRKQVLGDISASAGAELDPSSNNGRIVNIITNDFPQYYALVSRITQDVALVDEKGTTITSTLTPKVQVVIPEKALQKSVKVALQTLSVPNETVVEMFGTRLSVSPVVAIEPRRRKFHKPIIITIPLPKSIHKSSFNSYTSDSQSLRLLCSISGGTHPAHWEDITGHTPLTFQGEAATFTSTVSARFWLIDTQNTSVCARNAQDLYREIITVPFIVYFVVFCKRYRKEIHFRVYCITDDKEEKSLEIQENFKEIAKSNEVEVLDKRPVYLQIDDRFIVTSKSDIPLSFIFIAFRENRLAFSVRIRDEVNDFSLSQLTFFQEKPSENVMQSPICSVILQLPDVVEDEGSRMSDQKLFAESFASYSHSGPFNDNFAKATIHLSDVAMKLEDQWRLLGAVLGLDSKLLDSFETTHPESPGLSMLRHWIKLGPEQANGNILQKALREIGREEIIVKCLSDLQPVMDSNERRIAMERIELSDIDSFVNSTSRKDQVGDATNHFHLMEISDVRNTDNQPTDERSSLKSSRVTNAPVQHDTIEQLACSEPKMATLENSIKSLAERIVHRFDTVAESSAKTSYRSRIDSDQIVPQQGKSEVFNDDEEIKLTSWTDLLPLKDEFEVIESPVQRLAKAMVMSDVSLPNTNDSSDSTQNSRLSSGRKKKATSSRSFQSDS